MSRFAVIAAIAASYFVFAILLNSVGTVILQSINTFDITKPQAATLEGFKDLSIAVVSFLLASFIPRLGYKLALIVGLSAVTVVSLLTPVLASFVAIKLLFAVVGASFAVVKVAVYAIVGQLSHDTRSHSSLLNTIEGVFMIGVLSGYWIFSYFIDPLAPTSLNWMSVYYWLALIIAVALVLVLKAPITAPTEHRQEESGQQAFLAMLKLAYQPLVLIFILSVFLYVLVEQGIGSWLPTFNNEVLSLPVDVSVQITSVFAFSIAAGRLMAGQVLKYVNWFGFLTTCAGLMGLLIVISVPAAQEADTRAVNHLFDAPLAAFLLPLIGLFMAPIYPILNSVMLSTLDQHRQAAMTGLIVVFSALGGTTGSIVTGYLFEHMSGEKAFYMLLIPIAGIVVSLFVFRSLSTRFYGAHQGLEV